MNDELRYFKSFEEGDNITITCDFVNNVEKIEQQLQEQQQWVNYYKDYVIKANMIFRKINMLQINELEDIKNDISKIRGENNE